MKRWVGGQTGGVQGRERSRGKEWHLQSLRWEKVCCIQGMEMVQRQQVGEEWLFGLGGRRGLITTALRLGPVRRCGVSQELRESWRPHP